MSEEIEYKGFKIRIENDESPENPFEAWDCEPPLLAFNCDYGRGSLTAYQGAPENLRDFIRLLPDACFERGKRVELANAFGVSMKALAEMWRENPGDDFQEVFYLCLRDEKDMSDTPHGWREAGEWFDTVETLMKWAGITCHNGQSNGYSQRESTLVLVLATPEWIEETGVQPENLEAVCKDAFDLYGAWAWGNVYGIAEISSPEGLDVEGGPCWGFYGTDHEKSGLMDSARASIDSFIKTQEAMAEAFEAALCPAE